MYGRLGMKNIENYSFIDYKKNLDIIKSRKRIELAINMYLIEFS
jgi:hypothetical protein